MLRDTKTTPNDAADTLSRRSSGILMSFSVLTAMATWLCQHLDMGWPSYSADPRLCAQVCSLAGVMMSAAEKSVANCSGVPNIAAMRSVYLAR